MKLSFRSVINTFGYGLQLNQYTVQCLESIFQRKENACCLVAEKFLRSLVEKYALLRNSLFLTHLANLF